MESPRDHELDNPDPLCDGDFAFWVPCVCSELQQARQEARERALDAAQEAVERASSLFQPLGPALAAIDALREEQADPPAVRWRSEQAYVAAARGAEDCSHTAVLVGK